MNFTLGTSTGIGSFNFYSSNNPSLTVSYLYPKDLDQDGIQELIIAGFETQPNTPETYDNTSVQIYGWNNGAFQNLTSRWLPDGSNRVEGVGDVTFGDFNGDGQIDVFLSAYTDMDHPADAYQLVNQNGTFGKESLGSYIGQHGATSVDINDDGYDDVFTASLAYPAANYAWLGGADGLSRYTLQSNATDGHHWAANGAGIAVGDFMNDGTRAMVVVDNGGSTDINLYKLTVNDADSIIEVDKLAELPGSRIVADPSKSIGGSHNVRVESLDFNNDGLLDVVVFSRADGDGTGDVWPEYSQVQFLANQGSAVFADVTDSVLSGYNPNTNVSYNPIFDDFNDDGFVDIFLSETSWGASHDSTTILAGTENGTWVDTGRSQLSALVDPFGGAATIIRGPDGWYIVDQSHVGSQEQLELTRINFGDLVVAAEPEPDPPVDTSSSESSSSRSSGGGGGGGSSREAVVEYNIITAESDKPESLEGTNRSDEFRFHGHEEAPVTLTAMDAGSPDHAGTGRIISLQGKVLNLSVFDGKGGADVLKGTDGSDAVVLDNQYSQFPTETIQARIKDIEKIETGAGDDLVDLTSQEYAYNNVTIDGGAGNDIIWSSQGDDTIIGGAGEDSMIGGAGKDKFVFNTKLDGIDEIVDFQPGIDDIVLDLKIFKKFKNLEDSWKDHIWLGQGQRDDDDFILYQDGFLSYDKDGLGRGDPVTFVELIGNPVLDFNDFSLL